MKSVRDLFDLGGRVAVITGGAGLLGFQHASAIAAAGGIPILVDIAENRANAAAVKLSEAHGVAASYAIADITTPAAVSALCSDVLARHGRVDILINNAANNPKLENASETNFSRFENFPIAQWEEDIAVGLTGAFLCSQSFGSHMAETGGGVILNIASDLAIIGPDQRLYRQDGLPDHLQPVKPVTYSIVKSALVGMTRYLATYWADKGVRVNAISPGGVYNGQPEDFVARLSKLIPMQRMATVDEYQGAILYLCSDASSYMTGANLIVDGGRTVW
jgi:NAD(P)-dependent dehydrogenase (short-subunit alcohol dehydrogenase family)